MKDMIRKYFYQMLADNFDIESAKDNLIEIVEEIAEEVK